MTESAIVQAITNNRHTGLPPGPMRQSKSGNKQQFMPSEIPFVALGSRHIRTSNSAFSHDAERAAQPALSTIAPIYDERLALTALRSNNHDFRTETM
jgi:hypothetical protein